MGKPLISNDRMYRVLVDCDTMKERGQNAWEFDDPAWRAALRKCLRYGYIVPEALAPSHAPRPCVARYRVTAEGRDFICRVGDAE